MATRKSPERREIEIERREILRARTAARRTARGVKQYDNRIAEESFGALIAGGVR